MLVSSIGHFSQNSVACVPDSGKAQAKHVVTKGLTSQEQENLKNQSLYKNLKETVGVLFNMYSDNSKDMKRSLDMIA